MYGNEYRKVIYVALSYKSFTFVTLCERLGEYCMKQVVVFTPMKQQVRYLLKDAFVL